jgi:hypothetical protein
MGIGFSCPAADSPFRGRLLNPNTLSVADRNSAPRLYDARTERLQESTGTYYLPDRIYSVYHQGERKWVYAITNHYGKFPEPFEFFYPGSVVEGKSLGAIIPTEHYRLSSQYVWARTPSPFIEQLILVLADPPFFKRIQYIRTDPPTGAK